MGRSVDYPRDAESVVFLDVELDAGEEYGQWHDFIDAIRDVLTERFPSLDPDDSWIGRELHSILDNCHARVVVSHYGDVVSISLVAKDEQYFMGDQNLAGAWCGQVSRSFARVLEERFPGQCLRRRGTMSNGVSVYERITG